MDERVRRCLRLEQIPAGVGVLSSEGLTDVSLATFQMFANLSVTGNYFLYWHCGIGTGCFITGRRGRRIPARWFIDALTPVAKTDAPTASVCFLGGNRKVLYALC